MEDCACDLMPEEGCGGGCGDRIAGARSASIASHWLAKRDALQEVANSSGTESEDITRRLSRCQHYLVRGGQSGRLFDREAIDSHMIRCLEAAGTGTARTFFGQSYGRSRG